MLIDGTASYPRSDVARRDSWAGVVGRKIIGDARGLGLLGKKPFFGPENIGGKPAPGWGMGTKYGNNWGADNVLSYFI
jgi:hypothetical protein